MKHSKSPKFLGLLALCLTVSLFWTAQPVLAAGPIIYTTSDPQEILPGETGTTTIKIRNVADATYDPYGFQVTIDFDPTVVQVIDGDPTAVGVQVGFPGGTYFEGKDYFIGRNWVDNDNGRIEFAATLYQPAFPLTEDSDLLVIHWHAVVAGWSDLEFTFSKLVDKHGNEIPHTVEDGEVGSSTATPIAGRVKLQGRSDNWLMDTLVVLAEEPCLPSTPYSLDNAQVTPHGINIIPDMPYTYTDDQGNFSITPYDQHDYRCLKVFQHGYLTGQHALPRGNDPTALGTITLLGGDVNEDDVVNIFDLVKIATHMSPGPYDKVADINLDDSVDIADLSIAAGNFGVRGPLAKWE